MDRRLSYFMGEFNYLKEQTPKFGERQWYDFPEDFPETLERAQHLKFASPRTRGGPAPWSWRFRRS